MKTRTLPRRFLPATLFLLAATLRAQSMELPAADAQPTETVSGPPLAENDPATAPANPRLTPKEHELLQRFDTNHDGKLDDQELAAAHEAMHQEEMGKAADRAQRLYGKLLEKFDVEKKGSLNPAEQAQALAFLEANAKPVYQKLLQKFDKNGDGKIDPAESQAMFAVLAQAPKFAQAAKDLSTGPRPAQLGGGRGLMARRIYEKLLASFDHDHAGSLSPAEQVEALAYLKTHNPRIYDGMVNRFDKDGDGSLEPAESQALFDTLAALPASPKAPAAAPVAASTAPNSQEKS